MVELQIFQGLSAPPERPRRTAGNPRPRLAESPGGVPRIMLCSSRAVEKLLEDAYNDSIDARTLIFSPFPCEFYIPSSVRFREPMPG